MSMKLFINTEKSLANGGGIYQENAGKAERQLAIQQGSFHHDIPGWSKRTHKRTYIHTYNALSGIEVIFEQQTGKLLYVGVHNKLCTACAKDEEVRKRTCVPASKTASSSMETDIILSGFLGSGNMVCVISISFSSRCSWMGICNNKKECANHALKCYRGSLEQLRSKG